MVNTAVLKATPDAVEPSLSSTEESDDWLNVNAEDFDTMLEQKLGKSKGSGPPTETNRDAMDIDKTDNERAEEDRQAKEQASRLNDLAKKVETFLDGKGDVEGAKFEESVTLPLRSQAVSLTIFSQFAVKSPREKRR